LLTDFPSVTRKQAVSVLEMAREAAGREAAGWIAAEAPRSSHHRPRDRHGRRGGLVRP